MTIVETTSMRLKVRESILDIGELLAGEEAWIGLTLAKGEDAGNVIVIRKDTILYFKGVTE